VGAIDLALRGILIGLSLGAPVGPINIEIARRVLRSGFRSGWLVGAGAISGDALYCLLVATGVSPLLDHLLVRTFLWIAGALFLVYLSYMSLRAGIENQRLTDLPERRLERRSYVTGFLMALLNPMGILFWLSIGGALVASGVQQADTTGTVAIVAGVIAGLGIWVTGLSTLVHRGRWLLSDALFRAINYASSVLLFGFAVWFVVQAVAEF
jgi:threonine/homoserine/homoserine lactone efflux protein